MIVIRRLVEKDRPALRQFWSLHWGADYMVVRGERVSLDQLDGFIAADLENWLGLITFSIKGSSCEIFSLDSLMENQGIGSGLLKVVEQEARLAGCQTLTLITTNDNTHALRFYQKRGFVLTNLYPGAVNTSRRLKPSIPLTGFDGIPIRDEIELQYALV